MSGWLKVGAEITLFLAVMAWAYRHMMRHAISVDVTVEVEHADRCDECDEAELRRLHEQDMQRLNEQLRIEALAYAEAQRDLTDEKIAAFIGGAR